MHKLSIAQQILSKYPQDNLLLIVIILCTEFDRGLNARPSVFVIYKQLPFWDGIVGEAKWISPNEMQTVAVKQGYPLMPSIDRMLVGRFPPRGLKKNF